MRSSVKLLFISLILAFSLFNQVLAQTNSSLIINELMINPNNVASLPPFEYIELYNNSLEVVDLKNISIQINSNSQSLPAYKIAPKQYVILCQEAAESQFSRYGNAIALPRWFALNNTNATIRLLQSDIVIDEISYRDSWYNSTTKRNGGWSLERINPSWNCNINLNWSATNSLSGGTPGKNNSIFNEKFIPSLSIVNYDISQNRISLTFSLESAYFSNLENTEFIVDQEIGLANNIQQIDDKIQLTFSKNLDEQKIYTLRIVGLKICNLELPAFDITLFQQNEINPGDVIINEILFNPKEGGVDFVELYNTREFPINLQHFKLGNRTISNTFYLLEAKDYVAITIDKNNVLQHYPRAIEQKILQTATLPPYTNQQGNVTLYSDQNILLDSVYYAATMHSKHLIDQKGISLERLQSDKNIFYSASTLEGGATPGYQNSVANTQIPKNRVFLGSQTFSPNGDGYEDILEINYELLSPDYIITVEIYNEKGQLIRKLAHQNLAGTHGKLIWDGKTDSGSACPKGHYICFTQIFNHKGDKQNFKQPFVLINSLTRH